MRNEVSTIKSSHRVANKVNSPSGHLVLEKIMERVGPGRDGTSAGRHN